MTAHEGARIGNSGHFFLDQIKVPYLESSSIHALSWVVICAEKYLSFAVSHGPHNPKVGRSEFKSEANTVI
jgi:hypothetical protein